LLQQFSWLETPVNIDWILSTSLDNLHAKNLVIRQSGTPLWFHFDIVPERTHEDFQRSYQTRMARVKDRLQEYVDIDLPIVEDGGDW
jgi:hypothetical protein